MEKDIERPKSGNREKNSMLIVQAREDSKVDKVAAGKVGDLGCMWEAGSPCLTDELLAGLSKMGELGMAPTVSRKQVLYPFG